MTFRTRLLVAIVGATLAPLLLFAFGVREEIATRLLAQHGRRIDALSAVVERGLERENTEIARRLAALTASMPDDDRLRAGLLYAGQDRRYVLDYAERAMRVAGLDVLQLQDESGRILSSGHFRNDFDRLAPELPAVLDDSGGAVLGRLRTAEGPVLALIRADSVRMGGRTFVLIGGVFADAPLLDTFGGGVDLRVDLLAPDDTVRQDTATSDGGVVVREVPIAYVDGLAAVPVAKPEARLRILQEEGEVQRLQAGVDRWFLAALGTVALGALALGLFLSARLSRPLARLATATSTVSLEGPDLNVGAERNDEIGVLARRMASMTRRLRAGALQLRDAERRATVGDIARQVNHDIKNGLIPIRNVLRHLTQVQEQTPGELSSVFAARRTTLESSVGYLDDLARQYAKLTPRSERRSVDLAALASEVVRSASAGGAPVQLRSNGRAPLVQGDPVALRRIIDNLVRNGVESLTSEQGSVTVRVESSDGRARLVVADTGRGMTDVELARAFDDFHTTKATGTGLGLSVVRRLTSDLGATIRIETAPGAGTTVFLEFPATRA